MGIKEINEGTLSIIQGKKGIREEISGLNFQQLLKEAHSKSNQVSGPVSSLPPGASSEIQAHPPLPDYSAGIVPGLRKLSSPQSQSAQAAENTLGLLEKYQQALADHRISLKEINPLVQFLSREATKLGQMSEKLPPSDPLQKILTEIQVLSSVEMERFNRGDYI